jgi:hypothetical protein
VIVALWETDKGDVMVHGCTTAFILNEVFLKHLNPTTMNIHVMQW